MCTPSYLLTFPRDILLWLIGLLNTLNAPSFSLIFPTTIAISWGLQKTWMSFGPSGNQISWQLPIKTPQYVRLKRARSHKSPWITVDLKKLMHSRDIKKMKAVTSNGTHDWAWFKRMRNKVNVSIRQAKELFYKNKFTESDGDPRKTWQVINELTSRKRAGPRLGSWVWMVFQ